MAVPFDIERRKVTGQAVPAIANVIQALKRILRDSFKAPGALHNLLHTCVTPIPGPQ